MERVAANDRKEVRAGDSNGKVNRAWKHDSRSRIRGLLAAGLFVLAIFVITAFVTHSQSGRQKPPANSSQNRNSRKRETRSTRQSTASPSKSDSGAGNSSDEEDVVKVTSNLVPVPATVIDSRGVAVTNLKLEDFELRVDGQPNAISEVSRAETPVRMAMLFDNSGSLTLSREFKKHAAVQFFRNVLRPVDQAAVFSVATDVALAEPLTNDVRKLELTVESFGKP